MAKRITSNSSSSSSELYLSSIELRWLHTQVTKATVINSIQNSKANKTNCQIWDAVKEVSSSNWQCLWLSGFRQQHCTIHNSSKLQSFYQRQSQSLVKLGFDRLFNFFFSSSFLQSASALDWTKVQCAKSIVNLLLI